VRDIVIGMAVGLTVSFPQSASPRAPGQRPGQLEHRRTRRGSLSFFSGFYFSTIPGGSAHRAVAHLCFRRGRPASQCLPSLSKHYALSFDLHPYPRSQPATRFDGTGPSFANRRAASAALAATLERYSHFLMWIEYLLAAAVQNHGAEALLAGGTVPDGYVFPANTLWGMIISQRLQQRKIKF